MRCPKCESSDIKTESWEVCYMDQWMQDGDAVDSKNSDIHTWGIPPEAETTCQECDHTAEAKTFLGIEGIVIDVFNELLISETAAVKRKREQEATHERPFRHVDELYHLEALVKIRELKRR